MRASSAARDGERRRGRYCPDTAEILLEFGPEDLYGVRGFDTEPYFVPLDFENSEDNFRADQDSFPRFSAEN
jgi:hypothetical protein